CAFSGFGSCGAGSDKPSGTLAIQHLFTVCRNIESIDSAEERLRLASAEVKLRYRYEGWLGKARHVHHFAQKQHSRLSRFQVYVFGRAPRHRHYALPNAVHIDRDLSAFVFLLALLS